MMMPSSGSGAMMIDTAINSNIDECTVTAESNSGRRRPGILAKLAATATVFAMVLIVVFVGNDIPTHGSIQPIVSTSESYSAAAATKTSATERQLLLRGQQQKLLQQEQQEEQRSRKLQAVTQAPAPSATNSTGNSTLPPTVTTNVTLEVCGTCGLPILGAFVDTLSESLSTPEYTATVQVISRGPCLACGAASSGSRFLQERQLQARDGQEAFDFKITQTPTGVTSNSTGTNSTADGTNSTCGSGTAPITSPTALAICGNSSLSVGGLISIQAVLSNPALLNTIIQETAETMAETTGVAAVNLVPQRATVTGVANTPTPAPQPDGQLDLPLATSAPSGAANSVGNRMLMGRKYIYDIGRSIVSDDEEDKGMNIDTSMMDDIPFDNDEDDFLDERDDAPFHCRCVDCEEDEHCGGLWTGSIVKGPVSETRTKIHIVVSHCKNDLEWMADFTKGHIVDSVTVISKCGAEVRGAPEGTDVLILPNIGRCDHTYGYYMAYMLHEKVPEEDRENSVVFYLKDDISKGNLHQDGTWNSFGDMLQIASSERGFACGIKPSYVDAGPNRYFVSSYHEYDTLKEFSMNSYSRNIKGYSADTVDFLSGFNNIDEWSRSLPGNPEPQEIVQVCYGGVFSAKVSNVFKQERALWASITQSLSRGSNIQEGHYAERSWARLLSTPLHPVQIRALTETADGVYLNDAAMHGPLTRTPKIFIHAGAPVTNVAEIENALTMDADILKMDGYRIAVHGHGETGMDIDRLAACMWTGFESKTFTKQQKSSTFCPPHLLETLEDYLDDAMSQKQDVIISNPWLARSSTADSLSHFLDSLWEVHTVVYYRRYYDWISAVFNQWREDNHFGPQSIPMSTIRHIDFIREYCKRLFYGSMIPDDAPYRDYTSLHLKHEKLRNRHSSPFHPELNIEELTDLDEYTYFIAKQYDSIPRLTDKVHVVNYHDQDLASNLYCHVLSHARGACRVAAKREQNLTIADATLTLDDNVESDKVVLNQGHSYEELALGAYMKGRLQSPKAGVSGFHAQVKHWAKMIRSRLEKSRYTFEDLPVECLEDFEIQRLLKVSLAYEKTLLPEYFASPKGESDLRRDFASRNFCSLDVAETLKSIQWRFLFEQDENETLLKAFVHIGGPNTNSSAIQQALIQDQSLLAEDGYYMAVHGAGRSNENDDFVQDNMMLDTDLIGACLWDQEERDHVALSNKEASICKPGLLPRFKSFVADAASKRKNMLLSNEWLSHYSTEYALDKLFDDKWDVNIVLYYRRYFEWLYTMYGEWRANIQADVIDKIGGKVRFVDFTRLVNKRLFEAGAIGEHDDQRSDAFVDLVDIQEYTYQLWRQFTALDRFQTSVRIVDYHGGDWNSKLYCDVLVDADNACNSKTQYDDLEEGYSDHSLSLAGAAASMMVANHEHDPHTAFAIQDLVISAYYNGIISSGDGEDEDNELSYLEQDVGKDGTVPPCSKLNEDFIDEWTNTIKRNMRYYGMSLKDLPMECLDDNELDLLQDVSLSYEKLLLPQKFHKTHGGIGGGGAKELVQEFAIYKHQNRFCSLNVEEITTSQQYQYLFSQEENGPRWFQGERRVQEEMIKYQPMVTDPTANGDVEDDLHGSIFL